MRTLNRSPREEIRRAHIARAKSLLVSTNLQVLQVAIDSGFPSSVKTIGGVQARRRTGNRSDGVSKVVWNGAGVSGFLNPMECNA